MTNKISDDVIKYIGISERFSPASLCEDLHLSVGESIDICESLYLKNPDRFQKWYRIICPECGAITNSDKFENVGNLEISNCHECLYNFEITKSDIRIFYSNEELKKKSLDSENTHRQTKESRQSDIDLHTFEGIKSAKIKEFLSNRRSFIWHISDLHFKNKWIPFRPGHSNDLIKKFQSLMEQRGKVNLANDIIIISGDLTDSGSDSDYREFYKFYKKLLSLGLKGENILGVPGNHDSWMGTPFFMIWLSYFIPERLLFRLNRSYTARKYGAILKEFNSSSSTSTTFITNLKEIEIIRINSTLNREMARGIFPNDVSKPTAKSALKILVMHHHLIKPDNKKFDYGFSYFKSIFHNFGMRVINTTLGLSYLDKNDIDISLHGHKHVQYFKREHALNSSGKGTLISSSPSLVENNFDYVRGNCFDHNIIGLNIIIPSKHGADLIQLKLNEWEFTPEIYLNV